VAHRASCSISAALGHRVFLQPVSNAMLVHLPTERFKSFSDTCSLLVGGAAAPSPSPWPILRRGRRERHPEQHPPPATLPRLVKGGHGVFVLHVAPVPTLSQGGLCQLKNIHSCRHLCILPMGSLTGLPEKTEANQKARNTMSAFGGS